MKPVFGTSTVKPVPHIFVLERTVTEDLALLSEAVEITLDVLGESVLAGHEDALASGEFELSTTEGLLGVDGVLAGLGADGHQDHANVHTGGFAESLSVSVTHTGLESIGTGAGEHLVDAHHMPGMDTHSDVEVFLSGSDLHVLVGSNTGSFNLSTCDISAL